MRGFMPAKRGVGGGFGCFPISERERTFPPLFVREAHFVLLGQGADDAARVARRQNACGDIPRDHAAGADDGVVPDGHAAADDDVGSQPHVVADGDGAGVLVVELGAVRRPAHVPVACQKGMYGRDDGDVRPDKALLADMHGGAVEDDEVEVGKEIFADVGIAAVIEADRRLAVEVLAVAAEQLG